MGIEAKRNVWELGEINIQVYKEITSLAPRKIKSLVLQIFMLSELESEKLNKLKHIAAIFNVNLNLEEPIEINLI